MKRAPDGPSAWAHYRETRAVFERTARLVDGFYDADARGPREHSRAQRRVRALVSALVRERALDGALRIAELGCGRADLGRALLEELPAGSTLVGFDFSPATLGIARRVCARSAAGFALADLRALPARDRSFDVTLLINVLHHVTPDDQARVLVEAARVTRRALLVEVKNRLHPRFALFHPGTVLDGVRIHPSSAGRVRRALSTAGLARTGHRGTWGPAALSPLQVSRFDRV